MHIMYSLKLQAFIDFILVGLMCATIARQSLRFVKMPKFVITFAHHYVYTYVQWYNIDSWSCVIELNANKYVMRNRHCHLAVK